MLTAPYTVDCDAARFGMRVIAIDSSGRVNNY